jgi:hypothetical protein
MEAIKDYDQLLFSYGKRDLIPYNEFLKTAEWKEKRKAILNRDGHVCHNCKMPETIHENKPPYHFFFDGIDYDPVFDEYDCIVGTQPRLKLIPAPRAVFLHVHHTYYFFGRNPWEYPDEALITLCSHCHSDFHENHVVEWFVAGDNSIKLTPCPRCNGAGSFARFSHVQGGECFYCKGAMYKEFMK